MPNFAQRFETNNIINGKKQTKMNYNQLIKEATANNGKAIQEWQQQLNEIVDYLRKNGGKYLKRVCGKFEGGLCPWLQFITLDALEEQDHPHGIAENSIFLTYEIDFVERKMEIHRCGHVYISQADKERWADLRYLAMHPITRVAKERGVKGLRKCNYKNAQQAAQKMLSVFNDVMREIEDYTNGYPYKKGVKLIKTA